MSRENDLRIFILRKLALLAKLERGARGMFDEVGSRRIIDEIHVSRHEFLTETIPALRGETR